MTLNVAYREWFQIDVSCPDLSNEWVHATANLMYRNSGYATKCITSKTELLNPYASKPVADHLPPTIVPITASGIGVALDFFPSHISLYH